jgi:hypothetical protein
VVMMMCDQFGILHLPFAPARGYLAEMENEAYYNCKIPFHYYVADDNDSKGDDNNGGGDGSKKKAAKLVLQTLEVRDLVPDNCVFDDFLEKSSHRDMNLDLNANASGDGNGNGNGNGNDNDSDGHDDKGRSIPLVSSSSSSSSSPSPIFLSSSESSSTFSLSRFVPSLSVSSLIAHGMFFATAVGVGYLLGSNKNKASTQTK